MSTLDKNENGELAPMGITVYKTSPQKKLDLPMLSSGDPAEIATIRDASVDEDGNVLDMIGLTNETE